MTPRELLSAAIQHHQAGRAAVAGALYRRILAVEPGNADALHLIGLLAFAEGRDEAGLRLIRRAVAAVPQLAPAQANLGNRLRERGRIDEAGSACRRAAAARPDFAPAYQNLALVLQDRQREGDAEAAWRRCLTLAPGNPQAWLGLGGALRAQGRDAEAAGAYRAALARDPEMAAAFSNLGIVLRDAGRGDEAVRAHCRAVACRPDAAGLALNFAVALRDLGRLDEAVAVFDRAERLAPGSPEIMFNRSHALLLAGDFERGLPAYEARLEQAAVAPFRRRFPQPEWDGGDPAGRTILLHTEQGLGDTLNFARYATLLARRGARVVIEAERPLIRLLATLDGVSVIVAKGEAAPPPFDAHISLASLPFAFRTTLATIPAEVPYLHADPGLASRWRDRLAGAPGLKVGLVWAGNPAFVADRFRSPGLEALAPLLEVPGVRVFALQKGEGRRDLEGFGRKAGMIDLGPEIGDLMDTAAIMANLDLVVSSCTAPAHLAGALGRPVWVLQPFAPDWRWMLSREDSPWYPTMRLFRQDCWDDWPPVVARVAAALAGLSAQR